MASLSVLASLLGLAFAAEGMGLLARELNVGLAAVLLVLGALLDRPNGNQTAAASPYRWGGLVPALTGLLLIPTPLTIRLFAAALWFWGLSRVRRHRGPAARAEAFAIGAVLGGVIHFAAGTSSIAWYGTQEATAFLSGVLAELSGRAFAIGPTFGNLGIMILALSTCLGGAVVSRPTSRKRFAGAAAAIVLWYLAYLCVFAALPLVWSGSGTGRWPATAIDILQGLYPAHLPALLPFVLALPTAWYLTGLEVPGARNPSRIRVVHAAALVAGGLLAGMALANVPAPTRDGAVEVAFYGSGSAVWDVPSHERYGAANDGKFGNVPAIVRAMGWVPHFVAEISADSLGGREILVIIDPADPLPPRSRTDLEGFVRGGGALLMLGDHGASDSEGRNVLNDALAFCDIRFAPGTAECFTAEWPHSLQFAAHEITLPLRDRFNEVGVRSAALLEARYPAAPLLIGRYGYSDPATTGEAAGSNGSPTYDPGEPLGDVVLAAAQHVGSGRVVVADRSSFDNVTLVRSWRFAQRIFRWLSSEGQAAVPRSRDIAGLGLLGLLVVTVLVSQPRAPWVVPAVALSLAVGGGVLSAALVSQGRPGPLRGRIAVIDTAHGGAFCREAWQPDALTGAHLNLMREGYLPLADPRFDRTQILSSKLLLSVAPTRRYTAYECRLLRSFMDQGGTVVLCCGWEHRHAAQPLLDLFDLSLVHRPLGPGTAQVLGTEVQAAFRDAWPVRGGTPLVRLLDEAVVVRQKAGAGQLLVIGDSRFLLNRNLEQRNGPVMANVGFFRWLTQQVKERG